MKIGREGWWVKGGRVKFDLIWNLIVVVGPLSHTTHTSRALPRNRTLPYKMARIYIGNLPMDVTEKDMDDVFYKFGRIVDIDLKTPARPPAFGFITFQDARDAEEAVRAR